MLTSNDWRSPSHSSLSARIKCINGCFLHEETCLFSLDNPPAIAQREHSLCVCVHGFFCERALCCWRRWVCCVAVCAFPINIQNRYLLLLRLENCDVMEEDECVCVHVHLADFWICPKDTYRLPFCSVDWFYSNWEMCIASIGLHQLN